MRHARWRDTVAQDWENQACNGEREAKGLQENSSPLHKFREKPKTRKDQLGDAPIPPGSERRRERRRACGFQDILSDSAETMQLVGPECNHWRRKQRSPE